jgi:hypothetical protein
MAFFVELLATKRRGQIIDNRSRFYACGARHTPDFAERMRNSDEMHRLQGHSNCQSAQ